jgi:hypothetical protein
MSYESLSLKHILGRIRNSWIRRGAVKRASRIPVELFSGLLNRKLAPAWTDLRIVLFIAFFRRQIFGTAIAL